MVFVTKYSTEITPFLCYILSLCISIIEGDVCERPILSNKNLVQDWAFSATAYRESSPPQNARFKSAGSWCLPEQRNTAFTHYLEVELPRLYLVSTVATLGGVTAADYVTLYTIDYSVDGKEWNSAIVDGKQVISGNSASGNENVETRNLDENIRAKFLRFIPQTWPWESMACMRVEACGHQLPHAPAVLVKVKSSSIVMSWSKPDSGDDAIVKYYVRYWKEKEGKSSHKMFESTATSAVIDSNLSPFTAYQLEISGVSKLGEGLPTLQGFKTLEAVPSGSPTRITSTLLGTTAVNITWAPPDEDKRNGRITSYVICFPQQAYSDQNCKDKLVVPGSKTWYILRDVDLSVQHTVQIRAKTAVGTGPIGQGTTGVLEYTSPEGVASSLVIAVTFGVLLLSIIIIVILAAKEIILKNFVQALRKLTISQITLSTQNSEEGHAYEDTEQPPSNPQATGDDLYNTSTADHTDIVHEAFDNVRRMTLAMVEEGDIYGRNGGFEDDGSLREPLYKSCDQSVGKIHEQDAASHETLTPQLQQNHELRDEGMGNTSDQNVAFDEMMYELRDRQVVGKMHEQDAVSHEIVLSPQLQQNHELRDVDNPRDLNIDPSDISSSTSQSRDEEKEPPDNQTMDDDSGSLDMPFLSDEIHEGFYSMFTP